MAGTSQIPEELAAEMTPAVRAFVETLLQRIADLEARLNNTPHNSSLPPSTQHPHARPADGKPKSKHNRGGQPGHPRHERALIPVEEWTAVVTLRPSACRRCGTALAGDDRRPLRHQVWELPEIKPLVTEYQQHRPACPGCGETTCAQLPPGVPSGQSGPQRIACVPLLMAGFRQSTRRTSLFVESILNIPCCPSLTVKHQDIATQALQPAYQELVAALPTQPSLNGDESPTKEGPTKAWLWTFVAKKSRCSRCAGAGPPRRSPNCWERRSRG